MLPTTGPKQLRPHQTRALDDARKGLAEHDRGKLNLSGTAKKARDYGVPIVNEQALLSYLMTM